MYSVLREFDLIFFKKEFFFLFSNVCNFFIENKITINISSVNFFEFTSGRRSFSSSHRLPSKEDDRKTNKITTTNLNVF